MCGMLFVPSVWTPVVRNRVGAVREAAQGAFSFKHKRNWC